MTDFRSGPVSQSCTCWGWRSCSISTVWTWPSGPMNTPMNDCGLSTTERWVRGVGVGCGRGREKLFYKYGMDMALWAHEHSYERLWPVYDRKVSGGGVERSCSISTAWAWPSGPMNTPMNDCGLCMPERWVDRVFWGGGWHGGGGGWGGGRSCSISMAWTWPSGPMNTPMNDCGLSMTERWVDSWGGGRGVGVRFCQYGVDLAL